MKQENRQLINGLPRRILLMLLDCGLIVFCYYLAILLRFDGEDSIVPAAVLRAEVIRAMAPMLPYVLVIYMVVFWFGGLYEIMWEYAGMRDLARLTCLSGLATGFILLFDLIFRTRPIWSFMFITVACGAISGFHATQSPLMARCLKSEKQGHFVFYGAMVSEGIIALIWAAAGCAIYTGQELLDLGAGGPTAVYDICSKTMGGIGIALAMLGVIACPIIPSFSYTYKF